MVWSLDYIIFHFPLRWFIPFVPYFAAATEPLLSSRACDNLFPYNATIFGRHSDSAYPIRWSHLHNNNGYCCGRGACSMDKTVSISISITRFCVSGFGQLFLSTKTKWNKSPWIRFSASVSSYMSTQVYSSPTRHSTRCQWRRSTASPMQSAIKINSRIQCATQLGYCWPSLVTAIPRIESTDSYTGRLSQFQEPF